MKCFEWVSELLHFANMQQSCDVPYCKTVMTIALTVKTVSLNEPKGLRKTVHCSVPYNKMRVRVIK